MPVTKSELIEQLSESLKLPKGKAELVVNVMFDAMVGALERGERIEIRGFGSFEVRSYKPYEGRNPRTGEPVQVKAKRLPFFKVGKELRERVNASTGALEAEDQDDHDDDTGGDDDMGDDDESAG
jgi:integration host factor subunit beta